MSFVEIAAGIFGESDVHRSFLLLRERTEAEVRRALLATGEWAKEEIAGGAPVLTGDLRDSIGHSGVQGEPQGEYIIVGTGQPYGRRIELGYDQTDSAGRAYNQDPHPFFGPVVPQILPHLEKEIRQA